MLRHLTLPLLLGNRPIHGSSAWLFYGLFGVVCLLWLAIVGLRAAEFIKHVVHCGTECPRWGAGTKGPKITIVGLFGLFGSIVWALGCLAVSVTGWIQPTESYIYVLVGGFCVILVAGISGDYARARLRH